MASPEPFRRRLSLDDSHLSLRGRPADLTDVNSQRMLTKSHSQTAVPVFPGPLLPTVKRANKVPAVPASHTEGSPYASADIRASYVAADIRAHPKQEKSFATARLGSFVSGEFNARKTIEENSATHHYSQVIDSNIVSRETIKAKINTSHDHDQSVGNPLSVKQALGRISMPIHDTCQSKHPFPTSTNDNARKASEKDFRTGQPQVYNLDAEQAPLESLDGPKPVIPKGRSNAATAWSCNKIIEFNGERGFRVAPKEKAFTFQNPRSSWSKKTVEQGGYSEASPQILGRTKISAKRPLGVSMTKHLSHENSKQENGNVLSHSGKGAVIQDSTSVNRAIDLMKQPNFLSQSRQVSIRSSCAPLSVDNHQASSILSKLFSIRRTLSNWSISENHRLSLFFVALMFPLVIFSSLSLKILFLKRENVRLHELLEKCAATDIRLATHTFSKEFSLKGWDGSGKVSLLILLIATPYTFNRKAKKFVEASRNFLTGKKEQAPLTKRIAYGVDILFSSHSYMKPIALLFATLLLICGGGIALYVVSEDSLSDAMWRSWTYVADSGNHADREGTVPRIVSVLISFGGMLIFALMLGLISDAISEKVDSLRKGKSEVLESGHTLILGWSDKLGSLLKQLSIANQSLGGGVVVVLAERDKEEMELDIAKLEFDFMGTSVICRSGSPLIMADLKKVSVSKARAIIVLAEVENADQSDARALRVVLSLAGVKEGLKGHIVVEMSDLDNEALVKLVGGEMVETVVAHDVIGRLMIQCARQPGLAQIWEDILGFENAEFYIKRWPQLDGMCFGDVLISFPDAIPCGVKVFAEAGRIVLNPDDDYLLCEGDEILVIAEDDDTYAPAPLPQVRESPLLQAKRSQKRPQKILLCGWRRDIEDMIKVRRGRLPKVFVPPSVREKILFCGWRRDIQDMIKVLDAFLAPGSELWIFSDVPECDREKKLLYGNLNPDSLENIQLVHREGNTVIRRHLESLPLEDFDSILILADEKLEDTVVNADSSSLATLLLIRDIQSKRLPLKATKETSARSSGFSQSSWIREMHEASSKTIIISEILDSRTKNLVTVSKISDYVLSNELVSMALAMVAEDKQINRVLEELFAEEGNELYIRPAEFFLHDQDELSFFEIMIRARQRDELVIGYRRASADQAVINPPDKGVLKRWSIHDVFVVLAFEE